MRAALAALAAAIACAPAVGVADVKVDVRVTEGSAHEAWVEFSPDQGAFVALYGAFSDGSLRALFPVACGDCYWVEANEMRHILVEVPGGVRLESVEALASRKWFDPTVVWIASAPSGGAPENTKRAGEAEVPA